MRIEYRCKRNDELAHYGITGMKWGLRRYQNADGSLTDEGKLRYYGRKDKDFDVTKDVMTIEGLQRYTDDFKSGLKFENAGNFGKMEGQTVDVYDSLRTLFRKKQKFPDYSGISDEDLKKVVARMNMEQQYKDLSDKRVDKGHDYFKEILQTTGAVAGLALTLATLWEHVGKPMVNTNKAAKAGLLTP